MHSASAELVLKNVNLEVQPGEKVAIVGRTGRCVGLLLLQIHQTTTDIHRLQWQIVSIVHASTDA